MIPAALQNGLWDADGVWCQVLGAAGTEQRRPALFLDRDGVIVEEILYLHRVEDMAMIPGSAAAIHNANEQGVPVVVVSNQAGIGRGYYGWPDFQQVQQAMTRELGRADAHLDGVFACPHHPAGVGAYVHPAHPARKPRPGMLLRAAELMRIDLERSWIVGDKGSDLEAGREAGLRGGILVLTGHGAEHKDAVKDLETREFQVVLASSLSEGMARIPLFA